MLCPSDIAEKPFIPNFDLEIRLWWVFRKIWPLPESYSLWCVDAKSVLKMIFASISSRITRDRSLKTRPTYFSPSLATSPLMRKSLPQHRHRPPPPNHAPSLLPLPWRPRPQHHLRRCLRPQPQHLHILLLASQNQMLTSWRHDMVQEPWSWKNNYFTK